LSTIATKKAKAGALPRGIWWRGGVLWTRVTAPDGARTRRSLGTDNVWLAKRIVAMLDSLSDPRRKMGDLLQKAADGELELLKLYNAYVTGKLGAVRERLDDEDLEPWVARWEDWLAQSSDVVPRGRHDYVRQVRTFLPENTPFWRCSSPKNGLRSGYTVSA
jgi:hypothetical protein